MTAALDVLADARGEPCRRFPAPVEALAGLLEAWGALAADDPLAVPTDERRRRRRELVEVRRDEREGELLRDRERRKRLERVVLAARIAGAVA